MLANFCVIWHKAKPRTLLRTWHRAKPRTLISHYRFAVLDHQQCRRLSLFASHASQPSSPSRILRSNSATLPFLYLLYRYCQLIDEPHRTQAKKLLVQALRFHGGDQPPTNVPMQLLSLSIDTTPIFRDWLREFFAAPFQLVSLVSCSYYTHRAHQESNLEDQGLQFSSFFEALGSTRTTNMPVRRTRFLFIKHRPTDRTLIRLYVGYFSIYIFSSSQPGRLHLAHRSTMDGTRPTDRLPLERTLEITQQVQAPMGLSSTSSMGIPPSSTSQTHKF